MNTIRAVLSREDLTRWRINQSQIEAQRMKPDWFTRDEVMRAMLEEWRLIGEFTETYGLDDAKFISFSRSTGNIFESMKEFDPAEG